MSASGVHREIEIKLRVPNARAPRRVLLAAGFRVHRRRVFEDNILFDTPDLALRQAGKLLRVRATGGEALVTYKGPAEGGKHKSREELEFSTASSKEISLMLDRLGFVRVFRYQKYRTEFKRPREKGVVTLDETPAGCFLEVEGAPGWIDRTARRLGFQESDYITSSYGLIYRELQARQAGLPPDMVFPRRAT